VAGDDARLLVVPAPRARIKLQDLSLAGASGA
jgi:hypothetical protein